MFKIGDRVRIKRNLEGIWRENKSIYRNMPTVVDEMIRYEGMETNIRRVVTKDDISDKGQHIYKLSNDAGWYWAECYLEPVPENYEIESSDELISLIGGE